jgi:hypothetical protein
MGTRFLPTKPVAPVMAIFIQAFPQPYFIGNQP